MLRELAEVDAGREDWAGAAQHDAANRILGCRLGERGGQLLQELLAHRVALLGTVEDHVADRSAVLGDDHAHRCCS